MLKYISPEADGSPGPLTANRDGEIVTRIVVAETDVSHSGRYRCEPGAAPPTEVLVHVIDGKCVSIPKTLSRTVTRVSNRKKINA